MEAHDIASTVDEVVAKHFQTKKEFADKIGVSEQRLQKWRRTKIPAELVLQIEEKTGISRHELRPDLYPIERQKSRQRASA